MSADEMGDFVEALVDVMYGKSLNKSLWLFGQHLDGSVLRDDGFRVCVVEELDVDMFVRAGRRLLRFVSKFADDNQITIKCV